MDFVSDGLAYGRRCRCLNRVDDDPRPCLAIAVDTALPGWRVAQVLQRLAQRRELPKPNRARNLSLRGLGIYETA